MTVDLHTHSSASDGSESPSAVVAKAAGRGLSAIALTDHDTLEGLGEARRAASKLGVEVISGTELSLEYQGGGMHLVVLWLEPGDGMLQSRLGSLQDGRTVRNSAIVDLLNAHRMNMTIEEVEEEAGSGSVGRPHIAAVMLRKGYVSSIDEAFEVWLGSGCPAYVGRSRLSPEEAIGLAREAGAVPVLAHPHTLGINRAPEMAALLRRLCEAGLIGLEALYAGYRRHEREGYGYLARRFDLVPSGGSDYHGSYKPGLEIGIGYGDLEIGEQVLEELRAHAGRP